VQDPRADDLQNENLQKICVNGDTLGILPNLHSFLLQLQKTYSASPNLHFWADAICINQEDLKEKNEQVPMMSQIYDKAAHVVSWVWPFGIRRNPQRPDDAATSAKFLASQRWSSREGTERTLQHEDIDNVVSLCNLLYSPNYWRRR
jgi:hypothetical protein